VAHDQTCLPGRSKQAIYACARSEPTVRRMARIRARASRSATGSARTGKAGPRGEGSREIPLWSVGHRANSTCAGEAPASQLDGRTGKTAAAEPGGALRSGSPRLLAPHESGLACRTGVIPRYGAAGVNLCIDLPPPGSRASSYQTALRANRSAPSVAAGRLNDAASDRQWRRKSRLPAVFAFPDAEG
jgi:hypothetical protein